MSNKIVQLIRLVTFVILCATSVSVAVAANASDAIMGPSAAVASSQGQAIVNAAASQKGVPYCFDGGNKAGPTHGAGGAGCGGSTVGFDCSGLALYAVYQATGIILPHGHGMQAVKGGRLISKQANLQPGDLVFFGGGSLANFEHVGIYAGGGKMWDANDFNVPVQEHSLAWEEHGLAFDGGVRYWSSGGGGATSGGFEVAFQANTGSLWSVGASNHGNWSQGMMAGTSPSITALSGGGYEMAFQANTGDLITIGSAGNKNWRLGMMHGTSPSIAGLSGGGFEVAFQANTGSLWSVGASNHGAWNLGMMSNTSPSIEP
jgi:cell wall-associated NlpC family hydrolase